MISCWSIHYHWRLSSVTRAAIVSRSFEDEATDCPWYTSISPRCSSLSHHKIKTELTVDMNAALFTLGYRHVCWTWCMKHKTQRYLGCTVFSKFSPSSYDFGLENRVYDSRRTCHSEIGYCTIVTLCGNMKKGEISQWQGHPVWRLQRCSTDSESGVYPIVVRRAYCRHVRRKR